MHAFPTLKRRIALSGGALALTLAAPFAGFGTQGAGATPAVGGSAPAVGGSVGDVITTTCGNSPVIVLSVIVCQLQMPGSSAPTPTA